MNRFSRFLVLAILLVSPALFVGCGPSQVIDDEVSADDVGKEEADANPSEN